jgi:hypothetical protein
MAVLGGRDFRKSSSSERVSSKNAPLGDPERVVVVEWRSAWTWCSTCPGDRRARGRVEVVVAGVVLVVVAPVLRRRHAQLAGG